MHFSQERERDYSVSKLQVFETAGLDLICSFGSSHWDDFNVAFPVEIQCRLVSSHGLVEGDAYMRALFSRSVWSALVLLNNTWIQLRKEWFLDATVARLSTNLNFILMCSKDSYSTLARGINGFSRKRLSRTRFLFFWTSDQLSYLTSPSKWSVVFFTKNIIYKMS